jgi:hypothetical protein
VYVRCPNARCGREAIVAIPFDASTAPETVARSAARRIARHVVLGRQRADLVIALTLSGAALCLGGLLAIWQFLAPSPGGNRPVEYAALYGVGILGALVVVGGFVVDIALGAQRWLSGLPRVSIAFGRTPEMYRK